MDFYKLFHSWYNKTSDKAESIETLVEHFSKFGTENLNAVQNDELNFSAKNGMLLMKTKSKIFY